MKHRAIFAKDARHLLLPWSLVTVGALLSFVGSLDRPDYLNLTNFSWIIPFGIFLGVPLLSAIVYGHEFQHRTMTLLLAQPIERQAIWTQKLLVTATVVILPAVLFSISGSARSNYYERHFWIVAAAWTLVTTCAAPFWTFVTRSTIGALALNVGVNATLWISWLYLRNRLSEDARTSSAFLVPSAIIIVVYAFAALWLGHKLLQRYQPLDNALAAESALPGARLVPRTFANLFRARPTGAIANLIRREFYMLRLVWTLGILATLGWVLLIAFGIIAVKPADEYLGATATVMCLSILIALLAGALSLGEEKTWGTHAWHMTLPVPRSTQWIIKLAVALVSSLVAGALLPMSVLVIHGWIKGSPLADFHGFPLWLGPAEVVLLTLLAFWCASIVKGTVRAIVWVFPIPVILGFSFEVGSRLASNLSGDLARRFISNIDPTNADSALARLLMSDFAFHHPIIAFACVLLPFLAVGLTQSWRRFAADESERKMRIMPSVLPLLSIALVLGILVSSLWSVEIAMWQSRQEFLRGMHLAIQALAHPAPGMTQHFTSEQLSAVPGLAGSTAYWLQGATISITQEPNFKGLPLRRGDLVAGTPVDPVRPTMSYTGVVQLAGGRQCEMWFYAAPVTRYGMLSAVCR